MVLQADPDFGEDFQSSAFPSASARDDQEGEEEEADHEEEYETDGDHESEATTSWVTTDEV